MAKKKIQSAEFERRGRIAKLSKELQALVDAILIQAVKDYGESLNKLENEPGNIEAGRMKNDVIRFFFSDWFAQITDLSPLYLLEKIHKERGEYFDKNIHI